MIFFELLLLTFSIVYIIEHSGIIYELSKFLFTKLNPTKIYLGQLIPKPFSCSMCLTFWSTLLISLFSQTIIISLSLASSYAILSILINKILSKILELINKIN